MIDQVEGLAKVKKNYPNHSLHFAIDLCHLCIKLTRALIVDDRVKPSYWCDVFVVRFYFVNILYTLAPLTMRSLLNSDSRGVPRDSKIEY